MFGSRRHLVLPFVGGVFILAIGLVFEYTAAMVIGPLLMTGAAVPWRLLRGI